MLPIFGIEVNGHFPLVMPPGIEKSDEARIGNIKVTARSLCQMEQRPILFKESEIQQLANLIAHMAYAILTPVGAVLRIPLAVFSSA